jgi:hypothetical protein
LSLPTVVAFFLQLSGGCSLQNALDQFFMSLRGQAEFGRAVSKSALSQARKKLKPSAFSALNGLWVQGWHACFACEHWCGLRVVAADGTCVRVARWAENINAYGWGPCRDGSVVMARCVALFSTATRQVLEVTVGRYDEGERAPAAAHPGRAQGGRRAGAGPGLSGMVDVRTAAGAKHCVLRAYRRLRLARGSPVPGPEARGLGDCAS